MGSGPSFGGVCLFCVLSHLHGDMARVLLAEANDDLGTLHVNHSLASRRLIAMSFSAGERALHRVARSAPRELDKAQANATLTASQRCFPSRNLSAT